MAHGKANVLLVGAVGLALGGLIGFGFGHLVGVRVLRGCEELDCLLEYAWSLMGAFLGALLGAFVAVRFARKTSSDARRGPGGLSE